MDLLMLLEAGWIPNLFLHSATGNLLERKQQRGMALRIVSQKVIIKQTNQTLQTNHLRAGWNPGAAPVCQRMRAKGVFKQVVNLLVIGLHHQKGERHEKNS